MLLPGDGVMRILTGGTRVGSLPRGFLGLLNILPGVGKKIQYLEMWTGDLLGHWAGLGVRGTSHPPLTERGRYRTGKMKALSAWEPPGPQLPSSL